MDLGLIFSELNNNCEYRFHLAKQAIKGTGTTTLNSFIISDIFGVHDASVVIKFVESSVQQFTPPHASKPMHI